MARKSRLPPSKAPEFDNDILDEDSEEDEFANYKPGMAEEALSDEDEDEDEGEEGEFDSEEDEGEGVGVYEPDEWDEGESASDSESGDDDDEGADMKGLQDIPLDTLRKAQKALKGKGKAADEDLDGLSAKERKLREAKAKLAAMQKAKGKAGAVESESEGEGSDGERDEARNGRAQKRDNKHAPVAMSTKRQVSRFRNVVDVPRIDRRDPRFSSLSAGQVNAELHSKGYAFLPEMLEQERKQLRDEITRLLKLEKTCKLADKPGVLAQKDQVELQLSKVLNRLNRMKREEAERAALSKVKKEEREKRDAGKGAWFMKKAEKKDLLLKARFEQIEQSGGKRAVNKAIEKKRKKVHGKEKKSRAIIENSNRGAPGGKRRRVA